MNLGFLGLRLSLGLQRATWRRSSYLGATKASLLLLQFAGPMTGLIVPPLVGAWSDRTDSRLRRRVPYVLVGAVLCSAGRSLMPLSSSLL